MKRVLVLGAGLVAGPLVRYLLDQGYKVRVASRTLSKAEALIGDHPQGEARRLDVTDTATLDKLVEEADLAISLLPYVHHVTVAQLCIKHRKNMVTTSYIGEAMRALDQEVKEAGIIILNEIGLDPGIDHMEAMRIIDGVHDKGGKIASFYSYCGGLPAPEANTNPFGYKFSWSPRGVVLAAKNSARYLKDGEEISIPGEELFDHYWTVKIEGLGEFEAYPNRDSIPYIETYGIPEAETMYRGTLRNPGWCATWKRFVELGLLDEEEQDLRGLTWAGFMRRLIGGRSGDLKSELAAHLGIEEGSDVMKKFEWLGLLSEEPLPLERGSALDLLAAKLLEKLQYEEGERDMIVLQHEFVARYPDRREKIISTLIDFGIPGEETSMARTVGLPAAIGAKLILQGEIGLKGVQVPVVPEIYRPVLAELEEQGIEFQERREVVAS
ncbi:MAG: saccharopine dehydrogenase C-terminal domain-containing protein [Candidatus Bipolaricaulia bacterium]